MSDPTAAFESRPAASPPGVSRLSLGLSTGALYPGVATEDAPEVAAGLGVRDLEVMLQTPGEYGPTVVGALADACRRTGCRVHAVHTWAGLHPLLSPYARRAAEGRSLFTRGIEAAAELGARALVWHGPRPAELRAPDGWDRFWAATVDLAAVCGQAGVTLALENVSHAALPTVRDVAAVARRLDARPAAEDVAAPVGFAFDPFQAAEAGANPLMVLAAMGDRVVDVHLSDRRAADPEARHLPPGDGDLPWSALLRAVTGRYAGPLIVEAALGADPAVTLARVRDRLEPLLAEVGAGAEQPCAGTPPPGVLAGIELFNRRRFYESHEELEHEWHAERGEVRRLWQGILQIGVGFHHALRGNGRGALLLLGDGIAKTAAFAPRCRGIETGRLADESRACLDRLRALGLGRLAEFDPATIPVVHLSQDGAPWPVESGPLEG